MIDDISPALTMVAMVGAGLNGGVFFAFSTFVMRALGGLPAADGIAAMQAINREAPSPLFMALLFGTGIVTVATGASSLAEWDEPWAPALLAGSALYLICPLATIAFHVPRNIALDATDPADPAVHESWPAWRATWVAGNHVRTLACVASAVMFGVASRAM